MNKLSLLAVLTGCFCASVLAEGNIPDQGDLRRARESANETYARFLADSLAERLTFICCSDLPAQANDSLAQKTRAATKKLKTILKTQAALKDQIENYPGDDWDQRYGKTGLWRQALADIASTKLLCARCDFFAALTCPARNRAPMAAEIIETADTLAEFFPAGEARLLQLRIRSLTEPASHIVKEAQAHLLNANTSTAVRIDTLALLTRLGWKPGNDRIAELANRLGISPGKNNYELWLNLSLAALTAGDQSTLTRTLKTWPSLYQPVGSALLAKWSPSDRPEQMTPLESRLLAVEAVRTNATPHAPLLTALAKQPSLASAALFYAAAESVAETSRFKAIELYMRSADRQKTEQDALFTLTPAQIAAKGARAAYQLYYSDEQYLQIARDTLAYYFTIAGDEFDPQLKYLYGRLLRQNTQTRAARTVFTELWDLDGPYANYARFELLALDKEDLPADSPRTSDLRFQLQALISNLDRSNDLDRQLHLRAAEYYARWLLEDRTPDSANRAAHLLQDESADSLKLIRSQALIQLNQLTQAAETLLSCDDRTPEWTATATETLWLILEGGPQLFDSGQYRLAPPTETLLSLVDACAAAANPNLHPRAALVWTEITLLNSTTTGLTPALQSQIQTLFDELAKSEYAQSMNFYRCRALFFTLQKNYAKAQACWSSIAKARRPGQIDQNPGWQWWRAKYNELENWAASPQADPEQLKHAIDVLFSSFNKIPEPWAQKFVSLRESGKLKT